MPYLCKIRAPMGEMRSLRLRLYFSIKQHCSIRAAAMDAFSWLGVGGGVALLPSVCASIYFGYCHLHSARKQSNAVGPTTSSTSSSGKDGDVPMLVAVDGTRVKRSDVVKSCMALRLCTTYVLLQLGFLITVLSMVPMFTWTISAPNWRVLASALGSATGYLAFTPMGICLMMLSVFPNDTVAQRTALCLLTLVCIPSLGLSFLSLTNSHILDRPALVTLNMVTAFAIILALVLVAPVFGDWLRCGRATKEDAPCCRRLLFPDLSPPERLARLWRAIRCVMTLVGTNYAAVALVSAFADPHGHLAGAITTDHPEFYNGLAVGGVALLCGVGFTPRVRRFVLRLLGRRSRPSSCDKHAAHLNGFGDFYDISIAPTATV